MVPPGVRRLSTCLIALIAVVTQNRDRNSPASITFQIGITWKKGFFLKAQAFDNKARRKKSHQNDYFIQRKYFLNQENIMFYLRLPYIIARFEMIVFVCVFYAFNFFPLWHSISEQEVTNLSLIGCF